MILSDTVGQAPFLAQCVSCISTADGRVLNIRDYAADASEDAVAADCLDHVAVQAGDLVLALFVNVSNRPIVIGALTGAQQPALRLPSGYIAEPSSNGLRLKNATGNIALEIDTAGAHPTLKLADDDYTIDMAGRLQINARSIELQATLGNVNIQANDDVVVLGERVRLN